MAQPALEDLREALGDDVLLREGALERGLRAKVRGGNQHAQTTSLINALRVELGLHARACGGTSPAQSESLISALRAELGQLRAEVSVVAARAVPATVVCAASGKTHIVANAAKAHCGWPWASRAGAFVLSSDGPEDWCRKCCARADRLKREVTPKSP